MKKSYHMILTLTLVGIISSGALVGIYKYTQPMIKANQRKALEEAIFQVLPDAKSFKTIKKDKREIYQGIDSSGKIVGYAFVGEGPGYQGIIKVMIGVDPEFEKTLGIEVLESVETPGLGQKITMSFFRDQFHNLVIKPFVKLVKKKPVAPNEIQAITGATISSQAVVDIVNSTTSKVRALLGK
ncbi:RnfABCDGE type electron transport complex subunit G [Candidatus Aerophobetes bacterium]|uniref:Ion-translocating oxidoreductase complex subunit G n=1 Tax=Aerophobetes bacterium TaxID=2030807 RepID=A0A7V5LYT6_UNCAE|nr:RnfABCDGE type electron transport complex subunit G [Candidatus Aerophobetes bacterium]HHF98472.1 RnfABCDGE type electron transport complex subunit G [Candidatus Aerophobetes bacterium]